MTPIKVLVVDDSSFMRKIISKMLEEDDEIKVVGTARDGIEALKKIENLQPDVITLDVEMPNLNGLETLKKIMKEKPTPVIMLSAYTPQGADITLKALEYGAVDFVKKPSGEISLDIKKVQKELIQKIKASKNVDVTKLNYIVRKEVSIDKFDKRESKFLEIIVIIAASTGGPRALYEIVSKISKNNMPVAYLVVQHMPFGFTASFASRLNSISLVNVKEAEDKEEIKPETVYIAPGNFHMEIENIDDRYYISLNQKPYVNGVRPSADCTMISAVQNFKGNIIGVILTGMGKDGTVGAQKIKENKKGIIIAQDKETSVVFGMPKSAIEKGVVDIISPLDDISQHIYNEIKKIIGNNNG